MHIAHCVHIACIAFMYMFSQGFAVGRAGCRGYCGQRWLLWLLWVELFAMVSMGGSCYCGGTGSCGPSVYCELSLSPWLL